MSIPRHKFGRISQKRKELNAFKRRFTSDFNTTRSNARPPPGLRGRALGLFYRDRNKNLHRGTNDKPTIPFNIPIQIQSKIENMLKVLGPEWFEENLEDSPIMSTNSSHRKPDYKYGYLDLIKKGFDVKLQECLANTTPIISSDYSVLNKRLYDEYFEMTEKTEYKKMLKFRETLPTYKKKDDLLELINANQAIVISGETGCGKSTQVPQLILDDALAKGTGASVKIMVTQPRRIAATSLAQRVASERAEKVGQSVGYAIRLETIMPRKRGSITYCTAGVLQSDLEIRPSLNDITHVILDEVHERDATIDIIMSILKKVMQKRKDLKVILMSATLDALQLSKFFDSCPTMHIEGLAYPVQDIYLEDILTITNFKYKDVKVGKNRGSFRGGRKSGEDSKASGEIERKVKIGAWMAENGSRFSDQVKHQLLHPECEKLNLDIVFEMLKYISHQEPGAVLVFLPGIAQITAVLRLIEQSGEFPNDKFYVYPLHSKLPSLDQYKIFERPPLGVRKIIVATNIAETSITIDDIVYVVDCGYIKMKGYNVTDNVSTLNPEIITIANLRQRRGRAGRVQAGICYHLLTSFTAETLSERPLPELQRSDLIEATLSVKKLRLGIAAHAFSMVPDPPAIETIKTAVSTLHKYGALDIDERLTPLGWHLARIPAHPAAGKLLLLSALFGCLDRASSVAAAWGFKDPFYIPLGKEADADEAKARFASGEPSDHVAMSEAILQWEQCPNFQRGSFAYQNFVSQHTLNMLCDFKNQCGKDLKEMGFLNDGNVKSEWENRHYENISLFKAVLAASLYPNIATVRWLGRTKDKLKVFTPEDGSVKIHPSSVMGDSPRQALSETRRQLRSSDAGWLVYWMKQRTLTNLFLFDVTLVHTLPLLFFSESLDVVDDPKQPELCLMRLSSLEISCPKSVAELVLLLRGLLNKVLTARIERFSRQDKATMQGPDEELILTAVIELITAEDVQRCDTSCDASFDDEWSDDYSMDRRRLEDMELTGGAGSSYNYN